MFLIATDPARCEFSTTVSASHGGHGLGRALMSGLIAAAQQRGLREMEGFVLAKNQPMLRLASRPGFSVSPDPADASSHLPLAPGG
jgi:acetyltransferase